MTRSSHARRLACALCAVLPACSALGLGEFDRVPCDMPGKPSPCAKLNDELPADQCEKYYCKDGYGCELRPRDDDGDHHPDATACSDEPDLRDRKLDCDDDNDERYFGKAELCDGIDNDCDEWIDEDSVSDVAPDETDIEPGVERVAHVELAETLHLMLTRPDAPQSSQFETSHLTFSGGDFEASPALSGDEPVCEMRGQGEDELCNFTQLAITATSDLLVAAGVHSQDCADGQLRVGTGSPSDLGIRLGEADEAARRDPSSVAFGIDVNARACTASGRCEGASDPAIAVLPAVDGLGAQALVVWRSAGGACAEDGSASVAVLGLFIEGDTADSSLLRGTADGHGEELGTSAGSGGPALAAFVGRSDSSGYFVAYAGGERIELAFLPRLSDQSSATSAALFGNIDAAGADHVALTVSADPADAPRGLAAAYRIDTSSGPAIAFSQLRFDPDHAPHFAAAKPPVTFQAKGVISAGPSLAYAADGFSTDDATGGGWLIVWAEQTAESGSSGERLMAVRIAEAGLHPLGAHELAHGTIREPFTYFAPATSHGPSLKLWIRR